MTQSPNKNNSTTESDESIQLFARREKSYPKLVQGTFRTLKRVSILGMLSLYFIIPFLRWDRGAHAPDQAILIDLPGRRAYWFFIEIWPQEAYLLTGILVISAIALFFITSLFGRVWCGYICPQTVWTDIFVGVERLIQGDRFARQKLDRAPISFNKIWKKILTHFIWLLICLVTAAAFTLYFNDAPTLVQDILHFNVSSTVLGFIGFGTFSTYLMAGFARENVCMYMCPYARFQSAMFDPDTLIIGYDEMRGESRGKHKKGDSWDGRGHCIDCTACVQVCPTGIDIRNGLQMECIACGLCIDACNDIMDKIDLPRGLIRYDTERNMKLLEQGLPEQKFRFFRLRTLYYAVIISIVSSLMLYALIARAPLELHALHDRNPLFVQLSDGTVRNGYELKILNKTHENKSLSLSVDGVDNAKIVVQGANKITASSLLVKPDDVQNYHIFVLAPQQATEQTDITFTLKENGQVQDVYESVFVSKGKR